MVDPAMALMTVVPFSHNLLKAVFARKFVEPRTTRGHSGKRRIERDKRRHEIIAESCGSVIDNCLGGTSRLSRFRRHLGRLGVSIRQKSTST
jgi:hypothetical protein